MKKSTLVTVTVLGTISLFSSGGCTQPDKEKESQEQTQQQNSPAHGYVPGVWGTGTPGRSGVQAGQSAGESSGVSSGAGNTTSGSTVSRGGFGGGHVSATS